MPLHSCDEEHLERLLLSRPCVAPSQAKMYRSRNKDSGGSPPPHLRGVMQRHWSQPGGGGLGDSEDRFDDPQMTLSSWKQLCGLCAGPTL